MSDQKQPTPDELAAKRIVEEVVQVADKVTDFVSERFAGKREPYAIIYGVVMAGTILAARFDATNARGLVDQAVERGFKLVEARRLKSGTLQ